MSYKEAIDSFFCRANYKKAMKTLRKSFFGLILVILIKKENVLNFLIAIPTYVQGALQKKQLQLLSVRTLNKIKKIQHASTLQL